MLEWEKLTDEYSKKFTQFIFKFYPEWESNSVVETSEYLTPGSLYINVPSPTGNDPIIIQTDNNEVTVNFGAFHKHFDDDKNLDETFKKALVFIDQIINEEWIIISSNKDSLLTAILVSEVKSSSEIEKNIRKYKTSDNELYVRSWKGSYDNTI